MGMSGVTFEAIHHLRDLKISPEMELFLGLVLRRRRGNPAADHRGVKGAVRVRYRDRMRDGTARTKALVLKLLHIHAEAAL
jgi:hypothetical protein